MAKKEEWRDTVNGIIWDHDLVEEYRFVDDLYIIKSTIELIDLDNNNEQSLV